MEFIHKFDDAAYAKAVMKLEKMLDTEVGRKFFIHLVRSFVHNKPTIVAEGDHSIIRCDLTSKKIILESAAKEYRAHYIARLESFERQEMDTDEVFATKKEAYRLALISSNPYAVNGDFAYTNIKTDKMICEEAIKAIRDVYERIKDSDEYGDEFKLALKPYEKKPQKISKPTTKKSSTQIEKFNNKKAKKAAATPQKRVEFESNEKLVMNDFSQLAKLKVNVI